MMVRRLSLAGAALLAGGLLVAVSPAASSASSCGSGPCPSSARASVAPHDVLAGSSQAGFAFTVTNLGNATLDSVRIVRPSTAIAIRSIGQQPPGWVGAIDAPDDASYATISSPIGLAPGQTAVFQLIADVAPAPADSSATWSVLSRNASSNLPNGNNYQATPGVNNTSVSLVTTTHVLSTGAETFSPSAADDGTVTAGQTVTVTMPVTNVGTAAITPSVADSGVKGDTDGTVTGGQLVSAPTIAPGTMATLTYTGVTFPKAGTAVLRAFVANNAVPTYQASARVVTVQSPAGFAPAGSLGPLSSALSCDPSPANPGRALSCTLDVDKTGDVAATLSPGTTLAFSDRSGHTFSAPLSAPVSFAAGSDHKAITFASTVVPAGFAAGAYQPTVTWAGTDANGAAVSAPPSSLTDTVLVDDAPSMVTAARGQDSQSNPNVSVTFSEPVTGTYDVNNWKVVDSAGVLHAVVSVAGSPSAFWTLTLASSPAPAAGAMTVTYCGDSSCAKNGMRAGDLHDRENSPLATGTIKTS